jgi:hypothetical protein
MPVGHMSREKDPHGWQDKSPAEYSFNILLDPLQVIATM